MAGTLKPDPAYERFNIAKEKLGHYFRFKPRSALFNLVFMGFIPAGLTIWSYNTEGTFSFSRLYRTEPVLNPPYVPRKKDL
ncbi:hypothetical protein METBISCDRAFT_31882 [Metschnikowia bicuspidata]|uniref:NADH-ubiquinone oxidoreductase B15 subunit n=1 Tax=Metschnikowia bicuspidata TaxID=27322 RepID=A0A4P9Z8T8_9ASCO|nr:hypothetical protein METBISCDRAFT_31882 [Metschnikowia bicuspidata]